MRLIFAGTPAFAASALRAIRAAGHDVALVLTQPDRPAGRGMKLTSSAVAETAGALNLTIAKPQTLRDEDVQQKLRALNVDVMVVVAYGLLLPRAVLDGPRYGCINIHGSLLPRWRGAAPVQRAIEAGDLETGINIMQMDEGLDTGPVLLERRVAIATDDTSATLFAKLTLCATEVIVDALARLTTLTPQHQTSEGITYAKKIEKSEAAIDWRQSATVIERRMRAFDPFPGCESSIGEQSMKIWRAQMHSAPSAAVPGEIVAVGPEQLVVACGQGALALQTVQKPGGKRLSIAEYLRANPLQIGARFL
jgi:methionyl-tRNA formyltransferase